MYGSVGLSELIAKDKDPLSYIVDLMAGALSPLLTHLRYCSLALSHRTDAMDVADILVKV